MGRAGIRARAEYWSHQPVLNSGRIKFRKTSTLRLRPPAVALTVSRCPIVRKGRYTKTAGGWVSAGNVSFSFEAYQADPGSTDFFTSKSSAKKTPPGWWRPQPR